MPLLLPLTKFVVGSAVSVGVWKVIGDVVKNNVNVVTKVDAAKVWAGSVALSAVVSSYTTDHFNEGIDSVADWYEKRKKTDDTPEPSE